MSGDRLRRVNEAVREVLSGAITSELKDPRVGFVTVTAVETSPDLRHARVFVSVLGNPGERRRSLQALDNAHGFLQRRVGAELRMKNTPQLQFVYDDTPERGMRISQLLEEDGMSGSNGALSSREETLRAIRERRRFCLTTHEGPDGDAVGSLAAMQQVLTALGKDAVAFLPAEEFPLPYEYRFIELEGLVTEPPADLAERTLVFLDCGNIDRTPLEVLKREQGSPLVNIDHHHDNTRFGTINHVDPHASCTAEMVWDLMHALGVPITKAIGEALYVGLVTDTGRFMYENTGPRAHEMAAELLAAGIDAHAVYRQLYEGIPQGKLELLARGLSNVERFDGGLLTVTHLTRDDYHSAGADESYSEGVVDHLRSVAGTAVAGLVRDQLAGEPARKVSLRATDDRIDVSRIARALGGGGHRRAAGFSTDLEFEELVQVLRAQVAEQL